MVERLEGWGRIIQIRPPDSNVFIDWIPDKNPCASLSGNYICVPEAFFVGVGEEEFPGLAAVGGFVEAGLVSGAGGHDDGDVFVEGLDAAEVEFFGSGGNGAGLPEVAAV